MQFLHPHKYTQCNNHNQLLTIFVVSCSQTTEVVLTSIYTELLVTRFFKDTKVEDYLDSPCIRKNLGENYGCEFPNAQISDRTRAYTDQVYSTYLQLDTVLIANSTTLTLKFSLNSYHSVYTLCD